MKRKRAIQSTILHALCVATALLLAGCKQGIKEFVMPEASGEPYEVYIVMPEAMKGTALDDTLHSVLEYPMECTPNGDEYFKVRYLTPESFRSNIIRIVANVLVVDIDAQNVSIPTVKMKRNEYANHQLILTASARHADSLAVHIAQLQEGIRRAYVGNEINRRIAVLQKDNNRTQGDRLARLQNARMLIHENLKIPGVGATDSTFFWCTDNGSRKESHLVVYSIPYTSPDVFTLEGAVAVRDSVMRANIIGDQGAYMTTNKRIILPEYRALNIGGRYVGELRGVWRMENGLMAGPFVCHIRLDELTGRVVFAEGFCYAPQDGKRQLLRQLEASLYTLQLPSDNLIPEIEITL